LTPSRFCPAFKRRHHAAKRIVLVISETNERIFEEPIRPIECAEHKIPKRAGTTEIFVEVLRLAKMVNSVISIVRINVAKPVDVECRGTVLIDALQTQHGDNDPRHVTLLELKKKRSGDRDQGKAKKVFRNMMIIERTHLFEGVMLGVKRP
jgi:hypothetical protein